MYRGNKPRIIPILIAILIIGAIIAGLVSLGRMILFPGAGGDTDSQSTTEPTLREEVLNTDSDRSVRYTVRGAIIADENFRSYQIVVSPTERRITEYRGYLDTITASRTFPNNQTAYDEFVHALDKAEISVTRDVKDEDMRGVCATNGRLYVFETFRGNRATNTIWTSTCSGSPGTMKAKPGQIHALFTNQIPDFQPMFDKVY